MLQILVVVMDLVAAWFRDSPAVATTTMAGSAFAACRHLLCSRFICRPIYRGSRNFLYSFFFHLNSNLRHEPTVISGAVVVDVCQIDATLTAGLISGTLPFSGIGEAIIPKLSHTSGPNS